MGNLLISDDNTTTTTTTTTAGGGWEDGSWPYPPNLATPSNILIDASNGASDYGNKVTQPLVGCGVLRVCVCVVWVDCIVCVCVVWVDCIVCVSVCCVG